MVEARVWLLPPMVTLSLHARAGSEGSEGSVVCMRPADLTRLALRTSGQSPEPCEGYSDGTACEYSAGAKKTRMVKSSVIV